MLGPAFAILNSWTALAASLSLALPSGGPTSGLAGGIPFRLPDSRRTIPLGRYDLLEALDPTSLLDHWLDQCLRLDRTCGFRWSVRKPADHRMHFALPAGLHAAAMAPIPHLHRLQSCGVFAECVC